MDDPFYKSCSRFCLVKDVPNDEYVYEVKIITAAKILPVASLLNWFLLIAALIFSDCYYSAPIFTTRTGVLEKSFFKNQFYWSEFRGRK